MPRGVNMGVKSDMPGTFKSKQGVYHPDYGAALAKGVGKSFSDVAKLGLGAARGAINFANKQPKGFDSYKKGGTVKKTGLALVHKGEKVTPIKKAMDKCCK